MKKTKFSLFLFLTIFANNLFAIDLSKIKIIDNKIKYNYSLSVQCAMLVHPNYMEVLERFKVAKSSYSQGEELHELVDANITDSILRENLKQPISDYFRSNKNLKSLNEYIDKLIEYRSQFNVDFTNANEMKDKMHLVSQMCDNLPRLFNFKVEITVKEYKVEPVSSKANTLYLNLLREDRYGNLDLKYVIKSDANPEIGLAKEIKSMRGFLDEFSDLRDLSLKYNQKTCYGLKTLVSNKELYTPEVLQLLDRTYGEEKLEVIIDSVDYVNNGIFKSIGVSLNLSKKATVGEFYDPLKNKIVILREFLKRDYIDVAWGTCNTKTSVPTGLEILKLIDTQKN